MAKRDSNEASLDTNEFLQHVPTVKHPKNEVKTDRTTFQDLCPDVLQEIFVYLNPVELLCAFFNLSPVFDALLAPYTHTLDVRLTDKSCFRDLVSSLLPSFSNNLRVLRLSNAHTFSQISDLMYQFDWSHIKQLESLTLDSVKSDELSRYFLAIHPSLEKLWRLSLTFDDEDPFAEKLLLNHIFLSQVASVKNCFIHGLTLDFSQVNTQKSNGNLRELTLTLASLNDLLILCRVVPRLEILTCTIAGQVSSDLPDRIPSLDALTTLSLTINERIEFRTLQTILSPHAKLKRLSLNAILFDKTSDKEIGGFELEKFFRTFAQLTDLHFYLRQLPNDPRGNLGHKPDCLYLFSFTSHFWLERSIEVGTHFSLRSSQRYIYTLPFTFDTLDIDDDIRLFFRDQPRRPWPKVRSLFLSCKSDLDELIKSNTILKLFSNLTTITCTGSLFKGTIDTLSKHQWIQEKPRSSRANSPKLPFRHPTRSNADTTSVISHTFRFNSRRSRRWYSRRLDIRHDERKAFEDNVQRVRQLTIYEMTKDQLVHLSYFFPRIWVLTLHVDRSEWLSLPADWLHHLLTTMASLFSLTVYYPEHTPSGNVHVHDSFAGTLLAMKKHFFIKCTNGILTIWF